jgi:hypothetical protein
MLIKLSNQYVDRVETDRRYEIILHTMIFIDGRLNVKKLQILLNNPIKNINKQNEFYMNL